MLRDDRPVHKQSLRSQNYSPHARLQTSPTGKGKLGSLQMLDNSLSVQQNILVSKLYSIFISWYIF